MVRNRELWLRQHFSVTSNEGGRYVLPPQEEDFPVVIVHPEAGYFVTSCSELEASPNIQLKAWGRLELATTAHKDSQLNYYVQPVSARDSRIDRVRFESTSVLSQNGLWVFEGLVAGQWKLKTSNIPTERGPVVTIENGKTARFDFRSGRRSVTGQILLLPEGVSTEEPLAHLRLRTRLPAPPVPSGLSETERKAWLINWRTTPEGRKHRDDSFEVLFRIDSQGRFRIDDLPFGAYRLLAIFYRSMPGQQDAKPDIVGLVGKDFDLPEGEGEFDLGVLALARPNDARFG
jgi:hypothetical protein